MHSPRLTWFIFGCFLGAGAIFFSLQKHPILMKSDSYNYLQVGYEYRDTGKVHFDPWRAPATRAFNLGVALFTSHAKDTIYIHNEKEVSKLACRSVNITTLLCVQAVLLLVIFAYRRAGLWSLLLFIPFILDDYNNRIVRSVLSEGLTRLEITIWLALLVLVLKDTKRTWLPALGFLASFLVITREATLPLWGLTAVGGFWMLWRLENGRPMKIILFCVCLILPMGAWLSYNAKVNEFVGFSARGIWNTSGRIIPLARVDQITDFGSEPEVFKHLLTEFSEKEKQRLTKWNAGDHSVDGGYYYRVIPGRLDELMQEIHGTKPDEKNSLRLLSEARGIAFRSNIRGNIEYTLRTLKDYAINPFTKGAEGEGGRPENFIFTGIYGLALLIWLLRGIGGKFTRENTILILVPLIFVLLHALICSMANPYVPRYATVYFFFLACAGLLYLTGATIPEPPLNKPVHPIPGSSKH